MDERVSRAKPRGKPASGEIADLELGAMTWGAERALQVMVEYQVEALRFATRRTCCDLEFIRHLRHCTGMQDVVQLQQSWFKQCAGDYGEEIGRLFGTAFQLSTSDFAPLQRLLPACGSKRGSGNGR
ncbi:MAG: hypothetical protein WBD76_09310 [Methyloceanibacter sp.]